MFPKNININSIANYDSSGLIFCLAYNLLIGKDNYIFREIIKYEIPLKGVANNKNIKLK